MTTSTAKKSVSRRDVMRGAAGLGVLAPVALGVRNATAKEETPDYSDHPGVGVWIEGPGPTFSYTVIHGDGTWTNYNPWTLAFPGGSDPKLPVFGFGVWRPTGERTAEAIGRVAWGDTSVTDLLTFWVRAEVDETGEVMSTFVRMTAVNSAGEVLGEDPGSWASSRRMRWEPFEEPVTSEASQG